MSVVRTGGKDRVLSLRFSTYQHNDLYVEELDQWYPKSAKKPSFDTNIRPWTSAPNICARDDNGKDIVFSLVECYCYFVLLCCQLQQAVRYPRWTVSANTARSVSWGTSIRLNKAIGIYMYHIKKLLHSLIRTWNKKEPFILRPSPHDTCTPSRHECYLCPVFSIFICWAGCRRQMDTKKHLRSPNKSKNTQRMTVSHMQAQPPPVCTSMIWNVHHIASDPRERQNYLIWIRYHIGTGPRNMDKLQTISLTKRALFRPSGIRRQELPIETNNTLHDINRRSTPQHRQRAPFVMKPHMFDPSQYIPRVPLLLLSPFSPLNKNFQQRFHPLLQRFTSLFPCFSTPTNAIDHGADTGTKPPLRTGIGATIWARLRAPSGCHRRRRAVQSPFSMPKT